MINLEQIMDVKFWFNVFFAVESDERSLELMVAHEIEGVLRITKILIDEVIKDINAVTIPFYNAIRKSYQNHYQKKCQFTMQ